MESKRTAGVAAVLGVVVSIGMADADEGFSETFYKFPGSRWHLADYDFSHPHFDTDWRSKQVQIPDLKDNTGILLKLTPKTGADNRFDGASIRTRDKTGFGRYEATLQAAKGEGVVTGFFTYTGPYYGTQHDEIDIEFLGRDTTKMHVAWFVDGKLTNHFVDLGFDAASRERTYAFEWAADAIRWYAEDKLIFEHTAEQGLVPQTPGYLFANIWAADPSVGVWAGVSDGLQASAARIEQITYAPQRSLETLAFNEAVQ